MLGIFLLILYLFVLFYCLKNISALISNKPLKVVLYVVSFIPTFQMVVVAFILGLKLFARV